MLKTTRFALEFFCLPINPALVPRVLVLNSMIFPSLHIEINPCSSSPCENGGTCVNTLDKNYSCSCRPNGLEKTVKSVSLSADHFINNINMGN